MSIIIVASLSTAIHLTLSLLILIQYVNTAWWRRLLSASLNLPEVVGFVIWITGDTANSRRVFLYCQYFSLISMSSLAAYHFTVTLFEYLQSNRSDNAEVSRTGLFFLSFGVLGTFFLMGFQDYTSLMEQLEASPKATEEDLTVDGESPEISEDPNES